MDSQRHAYKQNSNTNSSRRKRSRNNKLITHRCRSGFTLPSAQQQITSISPRPPPLTRFEKLPRQKKHAGFRGVIKYNRGNLSESNHQMAFTVNVLIGVKLEPWKCLRQAAATGRAKLITSSHLLSMSATSCLETKTQGDRQTLRHPAAAHDNLCKLTFPHLCNSLNDEILKVH